MRSTRRRADILVMIVTALSVAMTGQQAHAQTPGSVVVVGTAEAHERGVVEAAMSNRVRDAAWAVVARPFSPAEIDSIVGCLADDRPWPCIDPTARTRGVERLVIAQVDRATAKAPLTIKAQLLVAGNDIPAIDEAYCDACNDEQLSETASRMAEQLLKDTSRRTRVAVLELQTVPSGAIVTLAGKDLGITSFRRRVPPGQHTVLLRRTGYRSESRTVTLAEGQTTRLVIELRPMSAGQDRRLVPGIVIGIGLAAALGGTTVSFTAEDSPEGQKHEYVYSGPGIGVAIGGALVASAGIYLWVRASRQSGKRAVPAVSTVPGGAVAGWATTF